MNGLMKSLPIVSCSAMQCGAVWGFVTRTRHAPAQLCQIDCISIDMLKQCLNFDGLIATASGNDKLNCRSFVLRGSESENPRGGRSREVERCPAHNSLFTPAEGLYRPLKSCSANLFAQTS